MLLLLTFILNFHDFFRDLWAILFHGFLLEVAMIVFRTLSTAAGALWREAFPIIMASMFAFMTAVVWALGNHYGYPDLVVEVVEMLLRLVR